MDKYQQMTELFLSNPELKGWHPRTVYETLKEMDAKGQLFVYAPKKKMKAFVGWVYAGDEYEDILIKKTPTKFLNMGRNVFPLFAWSAVGVPIMRKIGKKLLKIAKERGGKVWSWRNDRLMKFGLGG